MKTFFTVLAVIACWVIPVYMLFSSSHKSFALIYGLFYGLSWIVLCVLMAVREREIEELKMRKNNGSKQ